MMDQDCEYMEQAIALAQRGMGQTSPNPLVGAIIVKDGVVIGGGYHKKAGTPHAEPNAISDAESRGYSVEGATLYCTLEPCCHTDKKTPPCAQLIIQKKISRVVIGDLDPNPQVSGRGVELLKGADLNVTTGILQKECAQLNNPFYKHIKSHKAYLHLKIATTLDGRMATQSGDSKWISNESSRKYSHQLRCQYDAVLVGHHTLIQDNPSLTIRHGVFCHNKIPYKIILADVAKIDFSLPFFTKDRDKIIIANTGMDSGQTGIREIPFTDWDQFAKELYEQKIFSVLVEGGAQVATTLLESGECDEFSIFLAPCFIGNGPVFFQSERGQKMEDALRINNFDIELMDGEYRCIHWHWRKN